MFPIIFDNRYLIIYSYPLFMGLAWGIGYHYSKYLISKHNIKFDHFNLFFIGNFISAWLGSKLFFLFTTDIKMLNVYISNSNFWMGGGFVFYGGLIFATIFSIIFHFFIFKIELKSLASILVAASFAHAVGRIGCFLTGCCYGKPTDLIIGVKMHDEIRHPVQLYEATLLIGLGLFLNYLLTKNKKDILIITSYFFTYGFIRFILEFFRGDLIRGIYSNFSTSQYISAFMVLISGLIYIYDRSRKIS